MIDPIQLCPTCEVVKSPRSKHCNVCDRCVERMDHHCPWLNNCVGITNHIYFLLMINFYFINIVSMLALSVKYYTIYYIPSTYTDHYRDTVDFAKFPVVEPLLGETIVLNEVVVHVTNISIILLFVPYIYFVGFIWYRQTITLFTNKTTAERFGRKKANRLDEEEDDGESATTSLLAEKAIQSIGIRVEREGACASFKYLADFCGGSCAADCCGSGSGAPQLGFQEQIIDELYKNQKERHGYEEDWGLVVLKMNTEIKEEEETSSEVSQSPKKRPKKARAYTLQKKYEKQGSTLY